MDQTDTPRTDEEYSINPSDGRQYVEADFARALERESEALRADNRALRAALADCISEAPNEAEAVAAIERGRALLAKVSP